MSAATGKISDHGAMAARLRALFQLAVDRAHPAVCLPSQLPEVPSGGRIIVVGAGKADAAMAVATEQHYRTVWTREPGRCVGFVTTRHGFKLATEHLGVAEAAHPVPDDNSVGSAERTLDVIRSATPRDLVLVLLSGGASALWSAPVVGLTLADKMGLTRQLLRSGATISEINTVRRHLSRIKGGRLAAAIAATGARSLTLAISDVPGDVPAAIGSGPTVADPTTLADARAVLARFNITPAPAMAAALADPANETLKPGAPQLATADFRIVAAPKASLEAVAAAVASQGYTPVLLGDALEGEARDIGRAHAALAFDAKRRGDRVAILSGGELTVTVTGNGAGGPNQEYALGLAIALDGAPGIAALACDTDGIDGGGGDASDPAGAIILPDTLARSRSRHIDAAAMLSNNDSTGFFRAIGDLVACGPTQTNVNDCRIILVEP
jgi:glycerate 2-kinase